MLDSLPEDLANRWKRGEKARAKDYMDRQPELRKNLAIYKALVQEELRQIYLSGAKVDTESLLKDYPECRETILGFDPQFETLVATKEDAYATQLQGTRILEGPSAKSSTEQPAGELLTSRSYYPKIPGFDILSELGRGGMGVVYRARQISANRLVALKVVRNEVLDTADHETRANALERFRTEAKAAASLQHDNIISVYEVGEVPSKDTRSSPLRYYAMRFVQGTSLFDMIRKGPLENRRAAKYVMHVARALQAAHDQGILHRDMKPHNVMVEAATDRPLVADFGLAKFVHSDNSITYAGQIMGTPSYMSPEQAQDATLVKAPADQYSLGATLYHLLAGHPPFAAPTVQETIRQILEKPAVRLRESNPAIDLDLETICMKAIEKEPSKRYGSCQEFAEDLERYLDGRPIQARPVSNTERAWRWCRRNPTLAGMIGAVAALALSTFAAIIVGYRQTADALAVSESRLNKALQVVDDLFTQVSEDELLNEPGMQKLRTELLQRALAHYEYFLAESKEDSTRSDSKILEEVGKSNYRFGMIQKLTGKLDAAKASLNKAMAIQEQLLEQQPESIARLESLAETLNAVGNLASESEDYATALDAFERSHKLRVQLASKEPGQLKYQRLVCNTLMNIGLAEINLEKVSEGQAHVLESQEKRIDLQKSFPESDKLQKDIARGWFNLAKNQFGTHAAQEVNKYALRSVEAYRKAIELDKRSLSNQSEASVAMLLLGESYVNLGLEQDAQRVFEEGRNLAKRHAESNPDVVEYQNQLALMERSLGAMYATNQQWDRAEQSWKNALEITRRFHSLSPDSLPLTDDLVTSLCALGDLAARKGDVPAAWKYRQESMPGLLKLSSKPNADPWFSEQIQANRQWLDANEP
jgi:serine/threonine protein kinase/23S rRNA maturation mini-RNase III